MRTLILCPVLTHTSPRNRHLPDENTPYLSETIDLPESKQQSPDNIEEENDKKSRSDVKNSATHPSLEKTHLDIHSQSYQLQETIGLAQAIELNILDAKTVTIAKPKPGTLFGEGKADEIHAQIKEQEIDLVIVNHALTPVQQRNLERRWKVKILDRTALILEIFGERAKTREGRLQVELAHLDYQKGRLVRSWTHLERQRGGHGFLGGPGETQIEADRRQIRSRMASIRKDLEKVRQTRELHRKGRRKVPYPIVSLVGYTNAGKSTLFNTLTGANVMAKDMLFATLDPTMREVGLPSGQKIILSDTVGFISNLPTLLVAAFRATLEEVLEADIILHVRDISSSSTHEQKQDVENILDGLKVFENDPVPTLFEIWNKIDLLNEEEMHETQLNAMNHQPIAICSSATKNIGLSDLLTQIDMKLGGELKQISVSVEPEDGQLTNWLHEHSQIISREYDAQGRVLLTARITAVTLARLEKIIESSQNSHFLQK